MGSNLELLNKSGISLWQHEVIFSGIKEFVIFSSKFPFLFQSLHFRLLRFPQTAVYCTGSSCFRKFFLLPFEEVNCYNWQNILKSSYRFMCSDICKVNDYLPFLLCQNQWRIRWGTMGTRTHLGPILFPIPCSFQEKNGQNNSLASHLLGWCPPPKEKSWNGNWKSQIFLSRWWKRNFLWIALSLPHLNNALIVHSLTLVVFLLKASHIYYHYLCASFTSAVRCCADSLFP